MACMWKGEDSIEKIRFLRIRIEILQLGLNIYDKDGASVKIKVS